MWHTQPAAQVLEALGSRPGGLRADEVAERRARWGANALPEPAPRSAWARAFGQLTSPLVYLLLLAAAIAAGVGELGDAVVILIVVALNTVIGTLQEGRAEHALTGLRRLTATRARVVRDGAEQPVDARALVPGDVVLLAAGDAVVADARLLDAAALQTAEAALTGESTPVRKDPRALPEATALADRACLVHAGTHVTAGRARAVVVETGGRTEIGRIASLAATTRPPPTPLARRVERFGRQVTVAAGVVLVLVIGLGLARGMPLGAIAMIAISQVVGMIPEGLPVAMTIGLAVGVQRMAHRRAIIRRLGAVETLGATTVICSDKTGTLTRNEMTVVAAAPAAAGEAALHTAGVLCSDAELSGDGALGDPTEVALVRAAVAVGLAPAALRAAAPRTDEVPFDAASKLMATAHATADGPVVYVKGAPEVVLALVADPEVRARAEATALTMAAQALRVLALARVRGADLAGGVAALRGRAELLGLVGQLDPPRPEARAAVARCQAAGIRVVMVTGDHPSTALAIARDLGLAGEGDQAVDGLALDAMSDAELAAGLDRIRVFARVHPSQKLRVVAAYQARGDVVAVTGDGVNDAPALVRADVGVAMGVTGTDVAKEASEMVVTDDDFATIVAAIEEGRVVHGNIKKALLLLTTTSIAEVVILIAAMIAGLPAPFLAVQILWNNLVTEGVITVNLVMEPAEGDELRRRPVAVDEPLLTGAMLRRLAILTPLIVVVVLGWFGARLHAGVPLAVARSEAFTLLVVCEWFNVLNCRSAIRSGLDRSVVRNRWLLGGLVVGNLLQLAVVYLPFLNRVFHTTPFPLPVVLAIGLAGSVVLWGEELRKWVVRRRHAACSSSAHGRDPRARGSAVPGRGPDRAAPARG